MIAQDLNEKGWVQIQPVGCDELIGALVEYGKELGTPVIARKSEGVVQKLVPLNKGNAYPNSLSSKYATEAFPLHNDTAHWITPCRYLILGCMDEGESMRPTTLLDFSSLEITKEEKGELQSSPFIIKNGRNSFYANILEKHREFVRYDPGCMIPANSRSNKIADLFSSKRAQDSTKEVQWKQGMIIIIDNWRMLHGRGKPMECGRDRELYRVLVS
jgi:hypothetical protein